MSLEAHITNIYENLLKSDNNLRRNSPFLRHVTWKWKPVGLAFTQLLLTMLAIFNRRTKDIYNHNRI